MFLHPYTGYKCIFDTFGSRVPVYISLRYFVFYTDVLTYHVVSGTVFSAGLSDGEMPKTVEGKTLTVRVSAGK